MTFRAVDRPGFVGPSSADRHLVVGRCRFGALGPEGQTPAWVPVVGSSWRLPAETGLPAAPGTQCSWGWVSASRSRPCHRRVDTQHLFTHLPDLVPLASSQGFRHGGAPIDVPSSPLTNIWVCFLIKRAGAVGRRTLVHGSPSRLGLWFLRINPWKRDLGCGEGGGCKGSRASGLQSFPRLEGLDRGARPTWLVSATPKTKPRPQNKPLLTGK